MASLVKAFAANEEGATAIEYGIFAALIAVVIIVSVTLVGTDVGDLFNSIAANIAAATPAV